MGIKVHGLHHLNAYETGKKRKLFNILSNFM